MYLHLERPFATYTTWYRGYPNTQQLIRYYKANPDKTPKYVYIEVADPNGQTAHTITETVSEMFSFTEEKLTNGVLLTVEYKNF